MAAAARHRQPIGWRSLVLAGWLMLVMAVLLAMIIAERRKLAAELDTEAGILHRLVSQRADQHDAHLTALSAIATADSARPDLFLSVAATIHRFYPRITAIDLVPLQSPDWQLSTRTSIRPDQRAAVLGAALASEGQLMLGAAPGSSTSYLLVKRSPNTDQARFALALEIDGAALLDTDAPIWGRPSATRALWLPQGERLAGDDPGKAVRFDKPLGSLSQPLHLRAGVTPALGDLLPAKRLAALILITSLVYAGAVLGLAQLVRARRAEGRAFRSAQEARLAHASRVNALGEMASGMAHELTQPLTAILSQAQAGKHLCHRGDATALEPVMQGIAEQAKRAAAILERLRTWTRPQQEEGQRCHVGDAVGNVQMLLSAEAERNGIALSVQVEQRTLEVQGNPIELEQILFNLVFNAIEAATTTGPGRVRITARKEAERAVIDVADSGPGVPASVRDRLFEPFVTGTPHGTGLGLALCQRLAERMGGEVLLLDGLSDTIFRLSLPLVVPEDAAT